jgi:hypothetical protein
VYLSILDDEKGDPEMISASEEIKMYPLQPTIEDRDAMRLVVCRGRCEWSRVAGMRMRLCHAERLDTVRALLALRDLAEYRGALSQQLVDHPVLGALLEVLEAVLTKITRGRVRMRIRKMEEGLRTCTTSNPVSWHAGAAYIPLRG